MGSINYEPCLIREIGTGINRGLLAAEAHFMYSNLFWKNNIHEKKIQFNCLLKLI
jgi:hypothetical protein